MSEVNHIFHNLQNGNTALLQAARNGHIEIVKMAIEHGADINGATNVRILT